MKYIFYIVSLCFVLFLFTGCAPQTSMTVTTTPGNCPGGQVSAPYCMAVQMQNNSGGQNWISSTNYPFTNVSVSVSGVNNILSPSTNASMDPNGCTKNSTVPGGSCTFYLQINQEQYPVGNVTPVTITINYAVNNELSAVFGGDGGTTNSYTFTIHEYTNLYAAQQNGRILVYNKNGTTTYNIESIATTKIQSVATDNSAFGYVWIATNQGMYWFGIESSSGNTTYNPPGSTNAGISNIFTSQPSPFESAATSPTTMYGVSGSIYPFTFSSMSWGTTALATSPTGVLNNVNAVSFSGSYMVLTNGSIVYACPTSGTSGTCNQEATPLTKITSLGFVSTISQTGYTGLYVGTESGLYAESGISFPQPAGTTNQWANVTGGGLTESAIINVITTDDAGNAYAGDNSGNIWHISGGSNTATLLAKVSSSPITALIFDNIGNILFATSDTTLYQCPLSGSCSAVANIGNATMVDLAIGSTLSN